MTLSSMTTAKSIAELARQLAATNNGLISESVHDVVIRGELTEALAQAWWRTSKHALAVGTVRAVSIETPTGAPVEVDDEQVWPIEDAVITLEKPRMVGAVFILHVEEVGTVLAQIKWDDPPSAVYVAEHFSPFDTSSTSWLEWQDAPLVPSSIRPAPRLSPKKLCRDLNANVVPATVNPWLLYESDELTDSSTLKQWRQYAFVRQVSCIANEVVGEGGRISAVFNGPRKYTADLPLRFLPTLGISLLLNSAITWIYSEERDTDIRHGFLVNEIARESTDVDLVTHLADSLEYALNASVMAYRLHASKSTEQVIKLLADLRKHLSDDVARVTQQSRDLVSAMWRDLLITLTAVAARTGLLLAEKSAAYAAELMVLLLVTAALIIGSLSAGIYVNRRFNKLSLSNLKVWRTNLFAFLPADQYQKLALTPFSSALDIYHRTLCFVGVGYAIGVGMLAWSVLGVLDNRVAVAERAAAEQRAVADSLSQTRFVVDSLARVITVRDSLARLRAQGRQPSIVRPLN